MRNFSWKYFTLTGDVESFLLYKEVNKIGSGQEADAAAADGSLEAELEETAVELDS
ncbi:YqzL family protein [Paenibacillus protaetiae]|uniref:YqzL family protein n=1 Tax=Paenibacillus protaetiae TaxID=2509456 RepID=A0A4P6EZZ2_9BACL|nr:YqzL family protein [Paenibacillus protaetiae]QAY66297.1 YqzL family protein [Paenibacillus protaetiae]